jgi:alpha-L-fucosidase 2
VTGLRFRKHRNWRVPPVAHSNGGWRMAAGTRAWSRAWIIAFWARLADGEQAYENVFALLRSSKLPNLFARHPPFQIDGNFGATAAIAEMLVQSHASEIQFLPALRRAWDTGKITGLHARARLEVDITWRGGLPVTASWKPTVDTAYRLWLAPGVRIRRIRDGRQTPSPSSMSDSSTRLSVKAGHVYALEFERI